MRKHIIISMIFFSIFYLNCERKYISNVVENGDSYLPNIHWKIPIDNSFVDIDTVFVKSGNSFDARAEIFYDDPNDFKVIEIISTYETRSNSLSKATTGIGISCKFPTDNKLDSTSDKYIIDFTITPHDFKLINLELIISEKQDSNYDLKRFKTLYIANNDSL